MPEIFVLDEPSSNLDIGTIQDLQKILLSWKAQGKTIVIAEHRLAWLRGIADRVLFFKEGKIEKDLDADSFWAMPPEELHAMGLRAYSRFAPEKQLRTDGHEQIDLKDIRFSYQKLPVLNIPRLELPQGAVIAVLGDNGTGKTTFARLFGLKRQAICRKKARLPLLHGHAGRQPSVVFRKRAGRGHAGDGWPHRSGKREDDRRNPSRA